MAAFATQFILFHLVNGIFAGHRAIGVNLTEQQTVGISAATFTDAAKHGPVVIKLIVGTD